jgi:hypothetical protein
MDLAVNEIDSPILAAVVRAPAEASGLSKEHHHTISARYGLSRNARAIRGVWSIALGLDAASYLAAYGTQRLAIAASRQHDGQVRQIWEKIESSPKRNHVIELIDFLIEATATTTLAQELAE